MCEVPLYHMRTANLMLLLARQGRSYRGTSLIRKGTHLGPYCRPMPRVLGGSWGGGRFRMSEAPL